MAERIIVRNRYSMQRAVFSCADKIKHAVISITDPHMSDVKFRPSTNLVGVCKLKFYDIETPEFRYGKLVFPMDKTQAEEVVEFVNIVWNRIDTLFVHCEAGISRSSGTSAAISLVKFGHDDEFFASYRYSPNINCYRMVLEAFGYPVVNEEIEKKKMLNLHILSDYYKKINYNRIY